LSKGKKATVSQFFLAIALSSLLHCTFNCGAFLAEAGVGLGALLTLAAVPLTYFILWFRFKRAQN
jgi:hypothetical protein